MSIFWKKVSSFFYKWKKHLQRQSCCYSFRDKSRKGIDKNWAWTLSCCFRYFRPFTISPQILIFSLSVFLYHSFSLCLYIPYPISLSHSLPLFFSFSFSLSSSLSSFVCISFSACLPVFLSFVFQLFLSMFIFLSFLEDFLCSRTQSAPATFMHTFFIRQNVQFYVRRILASILISSVFFSVLYFFTSSPFILCTPNFPNVKLWNGFWNCNDLWFSREGKTSLMWQSWKRQNSSRRKRRFFSVAIFRNNLIFLRK